MTLTSRPFPEIGTDERLASPPAAAAFAGLHGCFTMAAALEAALNADWLETMTGKLIAELQKQLDAVAQAQEKSKGKGSAASRAADARTLSVLERTLDRLSRSHAARAAAQEKKIAKHDADARAALERRLDQRLAAIRTKGAAGKP